MATPDNLTDIETQIIRLIEERSNLVSTNPQNATSTLVAKRRVDAFVDSLGDLKGIDLADAKAILLHISAACQRQIRNVRVAFLGPKFSYSHLATIKYFGESTDFAAVSSIPAVFDSVRRGDCTAGIVPIENSTDGRIVDTLGMLLKGDMQICGEVVLPIHHNLLSASERQDIREVQSKPQALSQCRGWLSTNLPGAKIVEVSSTTTAAKNAAEQAGIAAVASIEAGREYGLDVLDSSIEDNPNNVTRFAVLGNERPKPTCNDKTSLLFQVHHQPGALADVMTIFKEHALNLTWIESFPSPDRLNEYLFFVELTGHRDDEAVQTAIRALQNETFRLTVLGSYPRAT